MFSRRTVKSFRLQIFFLIAALACPLLISLFLISTAYWSTSSFQKQARDRLQVVADFYTSSLQEENMAWLNAPKLSLGDKKDTLLALLNPTVASGQRAFPKIVSGFYFMDYNLFLTSPVPEKTGSNSLLITYIKQNRILIQNTATTKQPITELTKLAGEQVAYRFQPFTLPGGFSGTIWAITRAGSYQPPINNLLEKILVITLLGLLIGLGGAIILVRKTAADVRHLKKGLRRLEDDLSVRLPPLNGELGEVATAINNLARTLEKNQIERDRLEEHVRRSERLSALGQLVAGVAHEVRNPLTSVRGYIQFWQTLTDNFRDHPSFKIVFNQIDRLDQLIEKLLNFSRPDLSYKNPENLNDLLQETLALFGQELTQNNIDLDLKLDDKLPPVLINRGQIQQVLLNLLSNARDAMPNGGHLQITTAMTSNQCGLCLTISDNGSGIPEGLRTKIFDPFFTTKPQGTGLGLSISHEIVQFHDGELNLTSHPGEGTTATMFLPVMDKNTSDSGAN